MLTIANQSVHALGLLSDKLVAWTQGFIEILPNLVVAVLVMVMAVFVSRFAGKIIRRLLHRVSESETVTRLVVTIARIVLITVGLFASLGILNLEKTVTSLLAGAGVIGFAVGFAFQDIAANFFAGILIAFLKPYREGDIVQIDSYMGTVNKITLRTSNLTTFSGLEVLIPNKDMLTKAVTNFTSTPERRVEINGGVSYDDDLRLVEKLALEVAEGVPGRLASRPVEFYFTGYGDSSITFQFRFWILYPGQIPFMKATHEAIILLKQAFDRNKITIPFPIRTLDLSANSATDFATKLSVGRSDPEK